MFTTCFDECFTLRAWDLDTGNRTRLSERTDYGAWSSNGRHIAFGDVWRPGLYVADPEGTQVLTVLKDVQVGALSWSSDSQRIAFSQRREGSRRLEGYAIYEVALDGTGLKERTTHFDKWEHALPSTVVEERTWGQVKKEQR